MPRVIIIAKCPYSFRIFSLRASDLLFNAIDEYFPTKYPIAEKAITEIRETAKPPGNPRKTPFKYITILDGTGRKISETRIIKLNNA